MTDQAHELRRYARKIGHPAGDVPSVMLAAAEEIERLAARLEATEEDRARFLVEMGRLCAQCDALRARVEAMERQEPVATVRINAINGNPSVDFVPGHHYLHHNDKLYLAPGAQQCKNCNGMGDRFDPSGEKIPCDLCESNLEEIRVLVAEAAHDIISGSDFWLSTSLAAKKIYALPGAQAQPAPIVPTALLVAVADLVAQMEIVSRVGFVDMQNDKDSCAAFCVAEGTWLELMSAVESLASALAAAPEAKL